jgi:multisubunit Na+/H+ antiporter MnhF subunit
MDICSFIYLFICSFVYESENSVILNNIMLYNIISLISVIHICKVDIQKMTFFIKPRMNYFVVRYQIFN